MKQVSSKKNNFYEHQRNLSNSHMNNYVSVDESIDNTMQNNARSITPTKSRKMFDKDNYTTKQNFNQNSNDQDILKQS